MVPGFPLMHAQHVSMWMPMVFMDVVPRLPQGDDGRDSLSRIDEGFGIEISVDTVVDSGTK